jgi:endonuclease/exonuclease/phosphatase family metal-dependent hydrolase
MSFNIRLDVESDGVNQWDNRKEGVVLLIKEEKPDVLGIQEGLPQQIKYLSNQLDEYSMIGEGRDGGNNGEYSAIYYKNKKLRAINGETFWLSETPSIPSIGWDAALNRVATVGVFRIISSNKKLIVYNTHFDHIGTQAREKSVSVILNHIKDNDFINNATVVMGDLNAEPNDAPIKLLAENLEDSFNFFPIEKPFGTFNGFDLESKLLNRIDYIFTKNIEVIEYKHIQKRLPNKAWPSDHLPIFISIN